MLADLLSKATEIVSEEYPNSILLEAKGLPEAGHTINKVGDIQLWQLTFMYKHIHTVTLDWVCGSFAEPIYNDEITIGLFPIMDFTHLDLAAAISHGLKVTGESHFLGVTFNHPVVPGITEPRLLFVNRSSEGTRSITMTVSGQTAVRMDP